MWMLLSHPAHRKALSAWQYRAACSPHSSQETVDREPEAGHPWNVISDLPLHIFEGTLSDGVVDEEMGEFQTILFIGVGRGMVLCSSSSMWSSRRDKY